MNPSPWFLVMVTTWLTMILFIKKLVNTSTYSTPTNTNKPAHTQFTWPW